jgi:aminomethyltransferase
MRETPFYERLAPINSTHRWNNWAGYLVAERYQHSATAEYFATRNSVTVFDTSPLFKYRISGPDATDFLAGVLARDVRSCDVGQAQYTIWCEDAGFLLEDGVVLRTGENEVLAHLGRTQPGSFLRVDRQPQGRSGRCV